MSLSACRVRLAHNRVHAHHGAWGAQCVGASSRRAISHFVAAPSRTAAPWPTSGGSLPLARPRLFASAPSFPFPPRLSLPPSCGGPPRLARAASSSSSSGGGTEAIPFSLSPAEARSTFDAWVKSSTPYLTAPTVKGVEAVFLPFWIFAADSEVVVELPGGKVERLTRVSSTSPSSPPLHPRFPPSLFVYSGHGLPRGLVQAVQNSPADRIRPYSSAFLPSFNFTVEPFAVFETTAWAIAREQHVRALIESALRAAVAERGPGGPQAAAALRAFSAAPRATAVAAAAAAAGVRLRSSTFSSVRSRRVLLPAFVVTYRSFGEDFRVVINGVTGEAYGVAEEFVIPALQSLLRAAAGGARSAGPALLDLLHRFRLNPQLTTALVTFLANALRPALKILMWPPFLVGSFFAFSGYLLSTHLGPVRRHRRTFAEYEEARESERRSQRGMDPEHWHFRGDAEDFAREQEREREREREREPEREQEREQEREWARERKAEAEEQRRKRASRGGRRTGKLPPPVDERDPYAVLGVPRSATTAELAAAFRKQLLLYHPDHAEASGFDVQAASDRTRLVMEAYTLLRKGKK